jgi:hypothetical protein
VGEAAAKRQAHTLKILRPSLGMHVALRGRDARVPEELLHEARVRVPDDEAAGGVAQGVEAQRAQAGGHAEQAAPGPLS